MWFSSKSKMAAICDLDLLFLVSAEGGHLGAMVQRALGCDSPFKSLSTYNKQVKQTDKYTNMSENNIVQ